MPSLHWKSGLKSSSTSRRSPSCFKKIPCYPVQLLICQEYEKVLLRFGSERRSFPFVELVPSERTDHAVVVHALVDWYKRFGIAETRVCDKGSHFKNKVVAELNHILKTKHQFTTEYSPKSNGTVKKVNREIMQVLRSLVFEFKISWNSWSSLLPLKQSALNNYKSTNLAGQAPITVFTCFPAYNPLAVVLQGTDAIFFKQSKIKPDEVLALLTDLKESLEELHKKLRQAVLPKELEAAESLRSTSKLSSRWEIPFLMGQHSL